LKETKQIEYREPRAPIRELLHYLYGDVTDSTGIDRALVASRMVTRQVPRQ